MGSAYLNQSHSRSLLRNPEPSFTQSNSGRRPLLDDPPYSSKYSSRKDTFNRPSLNGQVSFEQSNLVRRPLLEDPPYSDNRTKFGNDKSSISGLSENGLFGQSNSRRRPLLDDPPYSSINNKLVGDSFNRSTLSGQTPFVQSNSGRRPLLQNPPYSKNYASGVRSVGCHDDNYYNEELFRTNSRNCGAETSRPSIRPLMGNDYNEYREEKIWNGRDESQENGFLLDQRPRSYANGFMTTYPSERDRQVHNYTSDRDFFEKDYLPQRMNVSSNSSLPAGVRTTIYEAVNEILSPIMKQNCFSSVNDRPVQSVLNQKFKSDDDYSNGSLDNYHKPKSLLSVGLEFTANDERPFFPQRSYDSKPRSLLSIDLPYSRSNGRLLFPQRNYGRKPLLGNAENPMQCLFSQTGVKRSIDHSPPENVPGLTGSIKRSKKKKYKSRSIYKDRILKKPWLNDCLKEQVAKKIDLFIEAKKNDTPECWEAYTKQKDKVIELNTSLQKQYLENHHPEVKDESDDTGNTNVGVENSV